MPRVSNTTHDERAVKGDSAMRTVAQIIKEARFDALDRQRLDTPLSHSELQPVIAARQVRRGIAHGSSAKEFRRFLEIGKDRTGRQ